MPEALYVSRIEGSRGEIWIRSLGVLVGRLDRPVLYRRRGDDTPKVGQFDLHAAVSYLNGPLFEDEDFRKEITVFVGKRPLKVKLTDSSKIERVEQSLRITEVEAEDG